VDSIADRLRETDAARARAWLRSLRNAVHDPLLARYLAWKYGEQRLLARAGYRYPAVCFQAPQAEVESVLGALDATPATTASQGAASRLGLLVDPRLTNGYVYVMRRLSPGSRLAIDCGLGRYFGMLDTCSALEIELRAAVCEGARDEAALDARLPLRKAAHEAAGGDPVDCGAGRDAAVGLSMLVACNARDGYRMRLARRGDGGLALGGGQFHVVPSGMFDFADARRDYNVLAKLREEYAEELFANRPGVLEYLDQLLADGDAQLVLTGVAVNLLNLRPEICTLLVIHDPKWFETARRARLNDEFLPETTSGGFDGWVRLAGNEEMITEAGLEPDRMIPPGAAAFWMGVDALRANLRFGLTRELTKADGAHRII
jgi:hypothetical protein